MGVADRAYMRRSGPPPIAAGASWTLRFVVLLALVHVGVEIARQQFGWRGRGDLLLSWDALRQGRVWTVLTAALLHADTMHLLFNLLGLWYFGKIVEETLGSAQFVAFFLLAAVLSHVPFVAAEMVTQDPTTTIGASGVVMATLVFAAFRHPGMPFSFIFFPVLLWQLAAVYVALDVFGLTNAGSSVDHWTHLGGAAFGFAVHRFGLPRLRLPRRARAARPHHEPGPYRDGNVRAEIDRILDKINAHGIGGLTDEEREFLRRNSGLYQ
jgi:membrane associated rhomboid family serine protease